MLPLRRFAILFAGLLSWASTGHAAPAPSFRKVLILMLENANYDKALSQPFLKQFAKTGALLTNYHAVTHPSQPNYVALAAGTHDGVIGDFNVTLDVPHIGDLLEAKGKTWKVYAQDYPGGCFLGRSSGLYARKHVPFLSFKNVQNEPSRCSRVVEASALADDIAAGTLPDYSLYIPNTDNDGHNTGVAYADQWLGQTFGATLNGLASTQGMLVVVTFDEDDSLSGNHIYAALAGDSVAPGGVSDASYDHYSLLRTIEDAFGLGTLGKNDDTASPISGIWNRVGGAATP